MRNRNAGRIFLIAPVCGFGGLADFRVIVKTVVGALHDFGSTEGAPFTRIDAGAFGPGDSIPREGAVYLDGVEQLSPEVQTRWSHWLEAAQKPNAGSVPRILASASDRLAARIADGGIEVDLDHGLELAHRIVPGAVEYFETASFEF